jgi:hypothetical protein
MNNENMPTMARSAHSHSTYTTDQLFATGPMGSAGPMGAPGSVEFKTVPRLTADFIHAPKGPAMITRRIVQVFISDPNENVPLEECILFEGKQKVSDATDQELFFELDIKELLAKHNERRVKIVDKRVKDRTEHLEPAKVRDLKMVVVTVATL